MDYTQMISALLQDNDNAVQAYFSCYQETLGKSIKIIYNKISHYDFVQLASQQGRTLTDPKFICPAETFYIVRQDDSFGLGKHRLHNAGFFYMQEVAASLSAPFLDLPDGAIVLDMCAAPGGKSIQITDKLLCGKKSGLVVSNEVSGSRIISLQHNLNRTAAYNSCVTSMQGDVFGSALPGFFDAVLVDAPCSGEGTGFKSDAGTKRRREDTIHKIARLQKELLGSAIKACKDGGSIVYSTCTINPRENEFVIKHALEKFDVELEEIDMPLKTPGITSRQGEDLLDAKDAEKVARFRPHVQHTGGFFIAKLRKKSSTHNDITTPMKEYISTSELDSSTKLQDQICSLLYEDFGITIDREKYFFVSTQKQVYLTSPSYMSIDKKIRIEKAGVPIYKKNNEELIPLHSLGNALGHLATKNSIVLGDDLLQKYSEGFDLTINEHSIQTPHHYCILTRNNYGFSVGKIVGDTLKNKFIK